jgi:hypothetical protein
MWAPAPPKRVSKRVPREGRKGSEKKGKRNMEQHVNHTAQEQEPRQTVPSTQELDETTLEGATGGKLGVFLKGGAKKVGGLAASLAVKGAMKATGFRLPG